MARKRPLWLEPSELKKEGEATRRGAVATGEPVRVTSILSHSCSLFVYLGSEVQWTQKLMGHRIFLWLQPWLEPSSSECQTQPTLDAVASEKGKATENRAWRL